MASVPRLDAGDRLGLVPLRLVVWIGGGIAVGPLAATACAVLFRVDILAAYTLPLVWAVWLAGIAVGLLGGCCRPCGLDLAQWAEVWLLRAGEPLRARFRSSPTWTDVPLTMPLARAPAALVWVVRSRPGGLDTYIAQKREVERARKVPAGIRRLAEAQRQHAAWLQATGAVRQTDYRLLWGVT